MVITVIRWSRFLRHQWYQEVRMPGNSLLNCYLGIQKYSFRSSPLSWRVEHTINRILETSTPLFLKAQNCPVLALTKINVVLYSCRSEIKGFLKMLLNQFVCGRYDSRAQRLPVHRQLEGSGSRESELVTSESLGQVTQPDFYVVSETRYSGELYQNPQENSPHSLSIYHKAPFIFT